VEKTQPTHQSDERSFLRRNIGFMVFLLGMALVGFLIQFQWIGYICISVYAAYAFWRHIPAKTTFLLAMLTMAVIPIAVVLSNGLVAQNFGAYSFVLFGLGLIMTIFELQRAPRTKK
jgi:hypothetical protein